MDNSALKKFALEKSKFLSLKDGEEVTVRFLSYEIVPNHFDGGETECPRYHIEIDGVKKLWESGSGKLADQMSKLSAGDLVSIKKTGEGKNTKYTVTKVVEE